MQTLGCVWRGDGAREGFCLRIQRSVFRTRASQLEVSEAIGFNSRTYRGQAGMRRRCLLALFGFPNVPNGDVGLLPRTLTPAGALMGSVGSITQATRLGAGVTKGARIGTSRTQPELAVGREGWWAASVCVMARPTGLRARFLIGPVTGTGPNRSQKTFSQGLSVLWS